MLVKWVIKFKENSIAISYSNLKELFIEAFKPYVSDISRYGLHSLRSGGATAADSHGIPDMLLKRHGRWLSESAKDRYYLISCVTSYSGKFMS